jgi:hypothetical protein
MPPTWRYNRNNRAEVLKLFLRRKVLISWANGPQGHRSSGGTPSCDAIVGFPESDSHLMVPDVSTEGSKHRPFIDELLWYYFRSDLLRNHDFGSNGERTHNIPVAHLPPEVRFMIGRHPSVSIGEKMTSVLNKWCQAHEVANLFVVDCGPFPTATGRPQKQCKTPRSLAFRS